MMSAGPNLACPRHINQLHTKSKVHKLQIYLNQLPSLNDPSIDLAIKATPCRPHNSLCCSQDHIKIRTVLDLLDHSRLEKYHPSYAGVTLGCQNPPAAGHAPPHRNHAHLKPYPTQTLTPMTNAKARQQLPQTTVLTGSTLVGSRNCAETQ